MQIPRSGVQGVGCVVQGVGWPTYEMVKSVRDGEERAEQDCQHDSDVPSGLISHKVLMKSFCKSKVPHKLVNLCFTISITKNKLTNLCGN